MDPSPSKKETYKVFLITYPHIPITFHIQFLIPYVSIFLFI